MTYIPSLLPEFVSVCERQLPKDERFVEQILPLLSPGDVLEVGAGCGQLSQLLAKRGIDVTASDIEPFFVEHQQQIGLKALRVNALQILPDAGRTFDNILTQGVSTLVNRDVSNIKATYRAVWDALNPGGRLIFIFPNAYQRPGKPWSTVDTHWPLIRETGFTVTRHFRHQIFPSSWYHYLGKHVTQPLEATIGRRFGMRNVFVLQKDIASNRAAA